ncbi:MAG: hypothetical protein IJV64_03245 [Oscillospiraceae bacterium]|nr:hypothetical protein [Oscillospiraceae bacterium]
MWRELSSEADCLQFLEQIQFFHDSCIKAMRYTSGAYVDDRLFMHPLNDDRSLTVVFQRQGKDPTTFEILFRGLTGLKLIPVDEAYTCEILDATLLLKGDRIWWCDCGGLSEDEIKAYDGTAICAESACWRAVDADVET